jgi:hypothetical protein
MNNVSLMMDTDRGADVLRTCNDFDCRPRLAFNAGHKTRDLVEKCLACTV